MKRVLVLGSEGQIGRSLCYHLEKEGYKVRQFDMNAERGPARGDLRFPHVITNLLPHYDFCFFLAFDVGGSTYLAKHQQTKEFLDNNNKIMLNTFESLSYRKTPFIFASSQMSNMAHSPYGLLKAIGEQYTRVLGGLTVKFWNVYGTETDPEKTHVITDFIRMARAGCIRMKTDGTEERQFLHADDASAALETVMLKYGEISAESPLHITSFEWTRILNVAHLISCFENCVLEVGSHPDSIQGVRNEPDRGILQYWKPKITLEEGIKRLWNDSLLTPVESGDKVAP